MKRKKNDKGSLLMNNKGFTLAEVMVSFVIVLLASQLLLSGIAAVRKIEKKASERSIVGDTIKEHLYDESSNISGSLRLEINGEVLCEDAWLYRYEEENGSLKAGIIRLDQSVNEKNREEGMEESE